MAVRAAKGLGMDLKPLTSLRFAAALLVFAYHAPIAQPFAQQHYLGEAGVGFFFVLSGFILTWTYHGAFSARVTPAATRDFYVARFARIYPLVVATTVLAVVATAISSGSVPRTPEFFAALAGELTLTKAWFTIPAIGFGLNTPSWSISDEVFFYALFPILAWYFLRALRAFSGAMALALAAAIWVFAVVSFVGHAPSGWFMYYFPPVRLIDFSVGMLLAIAFLKGSRLPNAAAFEWIAVAGVCVGVAFLPLVPVALRSALALMPLWSLLIFAFAHQRGSLSRILSYGVAVRLGEISFAFYLVHDIVDKALAPALRSNAPATLVVDLTVVLAVSFALFTWIETPLRRKIRAWHAAHTPVARIARASV